ncbi:voltage-dependent anion channel [Schizophyllum commune]
MSTPCASQKRSWSYVVRNFTPAWFAANMGTGAISILFHSFPYANGSTTMNIFTLIFFGLNVLMFLVFSAISAARYLLFPGVWSLMIHHPVQSLFLGTFPMGEHKFPPSSAFLYFLWACWWLDVLVSIAICFLMIHVMSTTHNHALDKMTAVWLLPVVTLIVASSTGGVIAPSLYAYSASHALITVTLSAVIVTIGLTLALMMLVIYLMRLIVHGLPPTATVISVFLPLGPTGDAAFSILTLGQCFRQFLPVYDGTSQLLRSSVTGGILETICTLVAFALWAMCTMWMLFAFLSIQNVARKGPIPFKVPFWGLIFPNGVYANITISLGQTFDSGFFRVWGAMYAAMTLCMWCYVAWTTLRLAYTREIFEAPCLENVNIRRRGRRSAKTPRADDTMEKVLGDGEKRTCEA